MSETKRETLRPLADKLKELRIEKGLSQEGVAKKAKITLSSYKALEEEDKYPRTRAIYTRLANVLGCEDEYLYDTNAEFADQVFRIFGSRSKQRYAKFIAGVMRNFESGVYS